MAPGTHRLRVTFTRREVTDNDAAAFAAALPAGADTGLFAGRAQREATEHARRAGAAIPPHLVLDTTVAIAPRQVVVVSLAAERRALLLLAGGSAPR